MGPKKLGWGAVSCGLFERRLQRSAPTIPGKYPTPFNMQLATPHGVMAIKLKNKNSLCTPENKVTLGSLHNNLRNLARLEIYFAATRTQTKAGKVSTLKVY